MNNVPILKRDTLVTQSTSRLNCVFKCATDHIKLLKIQENTTQLQYKVGYGVEWYMYYLEDTCPDWMQEWDNRWQLKAEELNVSFFDGRASIDVFINALNIAMTTEVQRLYLKTSILDCAILSILKHKELIIKDFIFVVHKGVYPNDAYFDYISIMMNSIPEVVLSTDPATLMNYFVFAFHLIIPLVDEIYQR
jgi:hypothetical protein